MDPNVVFSYTRKQALEDGVLFDITDTAKEIGFISSVAVRSAVWHGYIVSAKEILMKRVTECGNGSVLWTAEIRDCF